MLELSVTSVIAWASGLWVKNRVLFVLIMSALLCIGIWNKSEIKEYFIPKEDITLQYLDKVSAVESDLDDIRISLKANTVSTFIIHNGEVGMGLKNVHLMKYTLMFESNKNLYTNSKYFLYRQHLNPYVRYIRKMVQNGYFLVSNASTHKDPLIRMVGKKWDRETLLYIPLYNKKKILSGFTIIAFRKYHNFTEEEIVNCQRYLSLVEGHIE
jgi:hypothetical protein